MPPPPFTSTMIVSVTDSGLANPAVGTGMVNDSPGFQEAIDLVLRFGAEGRRGGVVYVPSGKYRLDDPLQISVLPLPAPPFDPHPIALIGEGYGSWLNPLMSAGTAVLKGDNISGLLIANLRIDGAFTHGILLEAPESSRFNEHIVIRDCWIRGAKLFQAQPLIVPNGIKLDRVRDCLIEHNHLSGNGARGTTAGLFYGQGSDITVDGTLGDSGFQGSTRVQIRGNTCLSTDVKVNIDCYNCSHSLLEGNDCSGAIPGAPTSPPPPPPVTLTLGGYGISLNLAHNASGLVHHNRVIGNTIHDTGGSGIYAANCDDSTILGNVVLRAATIQVDTDTSTGGIAMVVSNRCAISGNTISECGVLTPPPEDPPGGAPPGGTGLSLERSSDSAISGNVVTGCTKYGIWLRGTNPIANLTLTGNTIRDCDGGGIITTIYNVGGEQLIVSNNVVDLGGVKVAAVTGIGLEGYNNTCVIGNVVNKAPGPGILMEYGERGSVSNNTVIDASQYAHNSYSGLRIDQDHMTIVGNVSRSSVPASPPPPPMARPFAGLEVNGTRSGVIVVANQFGNNETMGIYLQPGTPPTELAIEDDNVKT